MEARKSLETISGMILNQLYPKFTAIHFNQGLLNFAAESVANEMRCLKAM